MAANRKLGRRTDQRVQMVYSQASQLLWHGKIETTLQRAKEVRKVAEKIVTMGIKTHTDTVTVQKQKLNRKDEKINVDFINDGPKKLAARRRMLGLLADIKEPKGERESRSEYRERTKDIKYPLVEKIFTEYAPKYAKRNEDNGKGGGYTRIIRLGNRRGDDAELVVIEMV